MILSRYVERARLLGIKLETGGINPKNGDISKLRFCPRHRRDNLYGNTIIYSSDVNARDQRRYDADGCCARTITTTPCLFNFRGLLFITPRLIEVCKQINVLSNYKV